MHELAVMESVVAAVAERVGAGRVKVVRLEVGRLSAVVPEALRFCFDICAQGTVLEGASLEMALIPGRGQCRTCGATRVIGSYADVCPCGASDLTVLSGEELRVKNVEVI
jgi:hydrogenase nickel incorporation protein HypA/HybF